MRSPHVNSHKKPLACCVAAPKRAACSFVVVVCDLLPCLSLLQPSHRVHRCNLAHHRLADNWIASPAPLNKLQPKRRAHRRNLVLERLADDVGRFRQGCPLRGHPRPHSRKLRVPRILQLGETGLIHTHRRACAVCTIFFELLNPLQLLQLTSPSNQQMRFSRGHMPRSSTWAGAGASCPLTTNQCRAARTCTGRMS